MKKTIAIIVLGFLLINNTFAADEIKNGKTLLKSLSKKSLTKKETIDFIKEYAITIEDERGDGVVTYIFDKKNYKRFKDFKVISEDAWRFSKLGALRLFNGDIKITWKIKLSKKKENLINIKSKYNLVGKLYEFSYQPKEEYLASLKIQKEQKLAEKNKLASKQALPKKVKKENSKSASSLDDKVEKIQAEKPEVILLSKKKIKKDNEITKSVETSEKVSSVEQTIESSKSVKKQKKSNDDIDLLASIKTQKKSNDINAETETTSGKKDEFQYTLNFIPVNTSNISEIMENAGTLSLFLGLNRNKAYGFYQGESINGVPNGKGKWSNCYSKRYQIISEDRKFIDTISDKYQGGAISTDEYISEISNKVKLALPLSYIAGGVTFDATMNEKRANYHFGDLGCEVIVGNWKNGSLNGYAKIFPLSIPKFIYPEGEIKEKLEMTGTGTIHTGYDDTWSIRSNEIKIDDLEGFWKNDKNINIKTIVLENPFFREGISIFYPYNLKSKNIWNRKKQFVNIWIRQYKNDASIDDFVSRITMNKGHGILSSLNEKGNPEGPGLALFADGSIILSNYKNGKMDLNQNIIAYINNKKNSPKYNSKTIGKSLEDFAGTPPINQTTKFANSIPNFSLALKNVEITSENIRKEEFSTESSFLNEKGNINQTIEDFWRKYSPYRSLGKWTYKSRDAYTDKFYIGQSDEQIQPFTYYHGKIAEFNDKGQLIYNGIGIKVSFTGEQVTYEEGEFKNGTFVKGFQLYDRGRSPPRTNIEINYSYKGEKPHRHTSELYYGTLNKNGPDGKGTMIIPNGVVYTGEWKNNNFHGKGELRRYRGKNDFHKACAIQRLAVTQTLVKRCSTKKIPSLKYSLKGEFKNGIPVGKMEGYRYWGKKDAAGTIRDIVKQDISGDYIKGKLLAKAPKKKIKRPEIKGSGIGDFINDKRKIKKIAFEIGCIDYEMVNQDEFKVASATSDYILMPCENYEEYEKVMAKAKSQGKEIASYDESGQKIEKKKKTGNKKTFKSGKSLFLNISKETEDSFFVEDVEVKKFKNPSKIQKFDFNVSKCQILVKRSKNTNKGDLNYENPKYIIDIENLLVKRTRKNNESGSIEEKIFAISQIFIPDVDQGPLNVSYYDDQKKNFVPQISSNEIKAFIDKYHFARTLQISTITPAVRIAFDFKADYTMTKYNLALADESLTIIIPLNKDKIKDDQHLKSGYAVVKRLFGMNLYAHGHGENKTATYNPMEASDMLGSAGKRIEEVCTSLIKEG